MRVESPNRIRINRALYLHLTKHFVERFHRLGDFLALVSSSHYTSKISLGSTIAGRNIQLGKNCLIERGSFLGLHNPEADEEFIKIGDNCEIRSGSQIHSWGGRIEIGNNCSLNANSIIYGTGGVKIGDNVRIAANSVIVASSHIFKDIGKPISEQGITSKGIFIQDDCWIGAGVCILDGITIGKGAVIGAGAVVTKNVPMYSICCGLPAKTLKSRI